jgi:excisionase family DNA binding protein
VPVVLRSTEWSVKRAAPFRIGDEQLLTAEDIAQTTRSSVRSVRRWISDGQLEAIRLGRLVRITPTALREFLHSRASLR